jgi:hypothetical protein
MEPADGKNDLHRLDVPDEGPDSRQSIHTHTARGHAEYRDFAYFFAACPCPARGPAGSFGSIRIAAGTAGG